MKDKFYFFNSFRDTIKSIEDPKLRLEYCEAIIDYGITGEFNTENSIINMLMVQTKFTIDRSDEISEERSIAGKKGDKKAKSKSMLGNQNARKNWEINTKQNKTEQNKTKQNEEEVEVEEEIEVESNNDTTVSLNNSNELLDSNNISISNSLNIIEPGQNKKKFGNEEINECLEKIKSVNDGAMDGSEKNNRKYAKNLICKIKNLPNVENGRITWQEVLDWVIITNKDDKYFSSKITSPENIYRNFGSLVNQARMKIYEQKKKQQGVF